MDLKFPDGITHFYDAAGVEHKPNEAGVVSTDNAQTISEMLKAGFTKIVADVKAEVEKLEQLVVKFFHHETGDLVHSIPVDDGTTVEEVAAGAADAVGKKVVLGNTLYKMTEIDATGTQVKVAPIEDMVLTRNAVHADTGEVVGQVAGEPKVGDRIALGGAVHEVTEVRPDGADKPGDVVVKPVQEDKKKDQKDPINDEGVKDK
jgi:hypothetical protein